MLLYQAYKKVFGNTARSAFSEFTLPVTGTDSFTAVVSVSYTHLYLAYPGKAYMSDWNAFVFSLSIPIASYFAAKYFVPFYRSIGRDRKSTRLNSSHIQKSRMPSSA